jgi:tRNA 2-thiouridine synthesizing protein E
MKIPLDPEGYLLHTADWSHDAAVLLARQAGIELTDAHWEVIELVRQFYCTFELSPSMRPLSKYIRARLGPDKAGSIYLMGLFPGSPATLAAKIAGLPKPANCF